MSFDYTPPVATIETTGGTITLRGLNVDDAGYLVHRNGELMNLLFEGDISVAGIITKAPALAADILACAADDRTASDKAARLPFGLQVRALTEVVRLTFSEAEMGEFLALFVRLIRSTTGPSNPENPAT